MGPISVNRQVQAVLAEEGLEHDAALTRALERIAALRIAEPPAPSGELARLLAASAASAGQTPAAGESATAPLAVVLPLTRAAARKAEAAAVAARPRWIKRHRGAMIGVLVAAGMGLGASGVAAMTGQAWDWHAPLHPAVGPSLTHDAEPSAPGGGPGTPSGAAAPTQDTGAGATGAGRTLGQSGARSADGSAQKQGAATSSPSHDSREQGSQDPTPQGSDRGHGSGGSADSVPSSQSTARPSPSAGSQDGSGASGHDGNGGGSDGQPTSR
ncbi:hypothetical protein [Sinomonas sp. RB5]